MSVHAPNTGIEWLAGVLTWFLVGEECKLIREEFREAEKRVPIVTVEGYVYGLGFKPTFLMWPETNPQKTTVITPFQMATAWRYQYGTYDKVAYGHIVHRIKNGPRVSAFKSGFGPLFLVRSILIAVPTLFLIWLIVHSAPSI